MYLITRISNDRSVSDIAKEVDIPQAIIWVAAAWKEVSETTIKSCFAKCGIVQQVVENDESELDGKFAELFKEITEMNEAENDFTAEEYIDFDHEISSFYPPINSEMVHWKAASIQECFNEYINKEQRIELDSEDDEEPDDIEDEQESFQVDGLVHTSGISNDDQNALFGIKENLERIVITQKKKDNYSILQTGHYLHVQKYLLLVLKILSCVFRIKLFFQVFVSFAYMSYNPDTGIKDPHFSLKL